MTDQSETTEDGRLDQQFLTRVGSRIRERRSDAGLTVQQLADRAQISRRLLTQIEHGQANPSLVTITRLARQLGSDFTTLVDTSDDDAALEVVGPDAQHLVWSSDNGGSARLLTSTKERRTADLWLWRLAPGDTYQGLADPSRSQELFLVWEGTLTVVVDGTEHEVPAGSAARLRSDRPYTYANRGDTTAVFARTVALAP